MPQINEGIEYEDQIPGDGDEAVPGKTVEVHYTGWLVDGTQFDSSHNRNETFRFKLGGGQVIQGWDLGVTGMKVGGVRKLTIAPEFGGLFETNLDCTASTVLTRSSDMPPQWFW